MFPAAHRQILQSHRFRHWCCRGWTKYRAGCCKVPWSWRCPILKWHPHLFPALRWSGRYRRFDSRCALHTEHPSDIRPLLSGTRLLLSSPDCFFPEWIRYAALSAVLLPLSAHLSDRHLPPFQCLLSSAVPPHRPPSHPLCLWPEYLRVLLHQNKHPPNNAYPVRRTEYRNKKPFQVPR